MLRRIQCPLLALLAYLALLLIAAPAARGAPRVGVAASAGRTFAAAARSVDAGGSLTVTGLQLEGQPTNSTLELQRLEVWDPAAQVVVHPGGGAQPTTQGPPDVRYFKGSVAGAPGSTVVLAVDAAGGVSGVATHGRQHWVLGRPALSPVAAAAGVDPAGLSSRRAATGTSVAADREAFRCGASRLEAERPAHAAQQQARGSGSGVPTLAAVPKLIASLALETDGELYKLLGGRRGVISYVGELVAYASALFKKEVGVELRITWLGLYANNATDPWPTLKTGDAVEGVKLLRQYWNNPANKRTRIKRTLVHMLSGQPANAAAFGGVLCDWHRFANTNKSTSDYGYGFTGGIRGTFDWSGNRTDWPTLPVWDAVAFIHEMGHQFGSAHTHEFCTVTPDDPTTIDDCGQSSNCHQDKHGILPSCTAMPGYAGGAGTIMSYCHTLTGGTSNIALTFGAKHPCGRRPQRVVAAMKKHVQDRAAKFPACFVPTVPAPPPAPVKTPNGKWSTPIIVPDALPFNSSVFSTYWATGAPERNCHDMARRRPVYVFRWFAARAYDNALVTVSSCGRLQSGGAPLLAIRSAAISNNLGPYGCVAQNAFGCSNRGSGGGFEATFKAAADTFYYLIVAPNDVTALLKPKLSLSVAAVMGNARGRWANPLSLPINPYAASTRTSWTSGQFKSFLPAGVPASLCSDGSRGRPYITLKWFSGTALKNGTAWRTTSKLTLSACYPTGANAVAVSVRSSKNLSNPAAGPFTCVSRMSSGCGTGKVGFKLDVKVTANTTYWFVVTPKSSAMPPASFRLTAQLIL